MIGSRVHFAKLEKGVSEENVFIVNAVTRPTRAQGSAGEDGLEAVATSRESVVQVLKKATASARGEWGSA